ncbi:MAG: DUF3042 family protein [Streptococcaceae bacterium]|jgi:hypothetical protein|nr:DUF3042 family protein [Streptococcaceae bacterium]
MKNKSFWIGVTAGAASVITLTTAALTTFHLAVVRPARKYEEWLDDNKRKANRKATRH